MIFFLNKMRLNKHNIFKSHNTRLVMIIILLYEQNIQLASRLTGVN